MKHTLKKISEKNDSQSAHIRNIIKSIELVKNYAETLADETDVIATQLMLISNQIEIFAKKQKVIKDDLSKIINTSEEKEDVMIKDISGNTSYIKLIESPLDSLITEIIDKFDYEDKDPYNYSIIINGDRYTPDKTPNITSDMIITATESKKIHIVTAKPSI